MHHIMKLLLIRLVFHCNTWLPLSLPRRLFRSVKSFVFFFLIYLICLHENCIMFLISCVSLPWLFSAATSFFTPSPLFFLTWSRGYVLKKISHSPVAQSCSSFKDQADWHQIPNSELSVPAELYACVHRLVLSERNLECCVTSPWLESLSK